MRKFSVVVIVLLVAMFMAPCVGAEDKKIEVPEYSLEGAASQVIYLGRPRGQDIFSLISLEEVEQYKLQGFLVVEGLRYIIDWNNDGAKDILQEEYSFAEIRDKDQHGCETVIPAHKQVKTTIDDNFDGIFDRVLFDYKNTQGGWGSDGEFDKEVIIPKKNK